jgi:hypothetical protein
MPKRKAERRQRGVQRQVRAAEGKRPKEKLEEAMQAGAREYLTGEVLPIIGGCTGG